MKHWLASILALALALPVAAGEMAGVTLPDQATVGDAELVLNGMGLRKKAVFKVYVAGLYLPEKTSDWQAVLDADAPRYVVMHWVRNVDKDAICGGWSEALEANAPNASAELSEQFDTLCEYMDKARSGDQFTFAYAPGSGTTVSVAGAEKGVIEGKEFADTLWASWIGPTPGPGEGFRDDLMGQ